MALAISLLTTKSLRCAGAGTYTANEQHFAQDSMKIYLNGELKVRRRCCRPPRCAG